MERSEQETEVTGSIEVGTPDWFPVHGRVAVGMKRRFLDRSADVYNQIAGSIDEHQLDQKLAASPRLDALAANAVNAGAVSGLQDKRRLLGRVVARAVLDEAQIDEAELITLTLAQIDAPHVRCLEEIRRAEVAAEANGEVAPIARGAEQELNSRVMEAGKHFPAPVIVTLNSLGLLKGTSSWDGVAFVSGTTEFGRQLLADLREAGSE